MSPSYITPFNLGNGSSRHTDHAHSSFSPQVVFSHLREQNVGRAIAGSEDAADLAGTVKLSRQTQGTLDRDKQTGTDVRLHGRRNGGVSVCEKVSNSLRWKKLINAVGFSACRSES